MFRHIGIGAAAVLLAGALAAGCSDDSSDPIPFSAPNTTVATRADQLSATMESNWSDNEESINRANSDGETLECRVFRLRDNSGIMVWNAGDDGDEQLWIAHIPATGGIEEPHQVFADVDTGGFGTDTVESFVMAAAPDGSIAMGFIATQDSDDSSAVDVASERAYIGTWTAQDGFTDFTAIDSNTVGGTGDGNLETMFVVTNLRDGTQSFDEGEFPDSDIEQFPTGSAGDSSTALVPMIFIGWLDNNSTGNTECEGVFFDLDNMDIPPVAADVIDVDLPTVTSTENVDTRIQTSGVDALFRSFDATDGDEMYLVRFDPVAADVESADKLDRGASTGAITISEPVLVGDGYRPINGQTSTWVITRESGFGSGTEDPDTDLVIYQVDDAATIEVDEFDHNALNGATGGVDNNVFNVNFQGNRGMSGVFIFYQQITDTATGSTTLNNSLYCRVLRLNDDEALVDNVSNEEQINATVGPDGSTNVTGYEFAELDPFCSPDVNNGATYVVFTQGVNADDLIDLNGVTIEVDDPTASPIAITAGSEDAIATTDDSWSTSLQGNWNVVVLESNSPDGEGVVFYVDQGNNKSVDPPALSFNEEQLVAFAPNLVTGQIVDSLGSTIINSHSDDTNLPFPQWRILTDQASSEIHGINTPVRAVQRDFASWGVDQNLLITIAEEELTPTFAYAVMPEYVGDSDGGDSDESYFVRVMSLSNSTFANPEDRFTPPLTDRPARLGLNSGSLNEISSDDDIYLLPEGDAVVAVFNQSPANDGSGQEGRVYINVMTSAGVPAEPALLSNDKSYGLEDFGDGFYDFEGSTAQWTVVPFATCNTAVGARYFQVRHFEEDSSSSEDQTSIQSRQVTGTTLSN